MLGILFFNIVYSYFVIFHLLIIGFDRAVIIIIAINWIVFHKD